eukprot:1545274-Prymnesium_polylepis.1
MARKPTQVVSRQVNREDGAGRRCCLRRCVREVRRITSTATPRVALAQRRSLWVAARLTLDTAISGSGELTLADIFDLRSKLPR